MSSSGDMNLMELLFEDPLLKGNIKDEVMLEQSFEDAVVVRNFIYFILFFFTIWQIPVDPHIVYRNDKSLYVIDNYYSKRKKTKR